MDQPIMMDITMNKLICSFKSNLPNEIEFAMQVATLLANTDNFSWSKDYPLVDAICSSLHVFSCICEDDVTLACDCYPRFWHKILTGDHANNEHLILATLTKDSEQSYLSFNNLVNHELEMHTKIYKRIKTTAELIKQFSMSCDITQKSEKQPMTEDTMNNQNNIYNNYIYQPVKKKRPKASPPLLKFISLLVFCDDTTLNLIGLDILSNIASKLSKLPEQTNDLTCTKLVQMFQEHCIDNISCQDGDIYLIIRSIEIISRLIASSNSRVYTSVISLMNERDIILRIEQLLTSRNDVNLFLAALEFFYRVSRHQPHLIAIRRAQHLIKILVNLLDCEDKQFFTATALKRIELVENDEPCESRIPPQQIQQMQPIQQLPLQPQQPPSQPKHQTPSQPKHQAPSQPKQPLSRPPQQNSIPPPPQQPSQRVVPQQQPVREYTCEWHNCKLRFSEPKLVYTHVFETHVGSLGPNDVSSCQWTGPNGSGPGCKTKRPKYSLLTHLNDFHCSTQALERSLNQSEPIKPPEHPGYGPNAALLAIRRHASLEKNATKTLDHSPLSVSVRLTAALILRNLATESVELKQALANHEPLLSEICMTNGRDESKIIAECLSLLSD